MKKKKVRKLYNKFSMLYMIKQVIDKYDFERLFISGAPEDEYYFQAKKLHEIISTNMLYEVDLISDFLTDIFVMSFGRNGYAYNLDGQFGYYEHIRSEYNSDELAAFYDAAKEIAKNIKWYHKIIPYISYILRES